jgi:hypothetical protein
MIREYAKPWFTYFRDYKLVLKSYDLRSWKELRECLIYCPDCVIPFIREHETAIENLKQFHLNHRELLYEFERSSDAIEEAVWNFKNGLHIHGLDNRMTFII